jgi:acetylornithine deacetylase
MKTKQREPMDIQPERLRNLLKNLIDIYSPSGKEEEILEYTEKYLKKQGLKVEKQEVDENRYNIIVLPEKLDEVDVWYVGHLDTVTAYDLDDYGFSQEEGTVYGLGASDMKAGCAAMIEAFTILAELKETFPPVGLALVVGEEEDSDGAKELIREHSFQWAIIGEPTEGLFKPLRIPGNFTAYSGITGTFLSAGTGAECYRDDVKTSLESHRIHHVQDRWTGIQH